jgi:hypothetical protein
LRRRRDLARPVHPNLAGSNGHSGGKPTLVISAAVEKYREDECSIHCSLPLQCDILAREQALPKSPKRTLCRPDARVHVSSIRAVAVDGAAQACQVLRRLLVAGVRRQHRNGNEDRVLGFLAAYKDVCLYPLVPSHARWPAPLTRPKQSVCSLDRIRGVCRASGTIDPSCQWRSPPSDPPSRGKTQPPKGWTVVSTTIRPRPNPCHALPFEFQRPRDR